VWGFLRAAAEEHPELACACIDLDPEGSREADLEALVAELCALDGREPSVAFRGTRRLVERLTASPLGSVAPAHADIRPEASYIVTGGLGGLGLAVAGRLVERGARRLVLVGRRVPSPDALQAIDRFATAGAQAVALQADVSSRADVERIVAEAERLGPLAGIVHAAGVIDDGILLKQTWERFARVAAGKVAGAVWLDHATRGRELDFICLFSSGASVLGSAGQTNYAAANAFLDAAASRLRHTGRPAVSVDWGPWATVGAAAARGLHRDTAIQPDEALAAFELAISRDASGDLLAPPRLAVLPLGPADDRSRSLLEELRPAGRTPAQGPGSARARPHDLAGVLEATAPNRRRRVLEDRVRDEAALVLGLDPRSISDLERPLSELGLDSLMAVELRNRLSEASGRALPPTLLFEYPSVSSLSAFLLHQLDGAAEGPQVEPEAAPESELVELTDGQVAERLAQKLDAIAGSSR
jgi:myxalamid-type polyketide synthase MxaC